MGIFEARVKIKSIEDARNVAERIGGIFKGYYYAIDIIFKPKKENEKGIIDLRIFKINNRQTKNYVLTHKIAEWSNNVKTDEIISKNKFDIIEEVFDFMRDCYGDILEEDYKYSRAGWEYNLGKDDIFVELIEELGPTIEIEAENKDEVENLFKSFEVIEYLSEPVPEIMRKLLKK